MLKRKRRKGQSNNININRKKKKGNNREKEKYALISTFDRDSRPAKLLPANQPTLPTIPLR